MATIIEAIGEAATSSFCALSAPVEKTLQLGEDWYNNADLPGFPSGPTPLGQGLRSARNLLCDEPPDDVSPEFSPSLDGGQCPGTSYTVTSEVVYDGEPPVGGGTGSGFGPLKRVRGVNESGGSFDQIRDVNDNFLSGGFRSTPGSTTNLQNIQITVNSGPDNCGDGPDIPPEYYVPDQWTDTPDVTYTPPSGPDITIPVGLVYAPVEVNIDGEIIVPVKVNFAPNVDVDAQLNLSTGDFDFITNIDVTLPTPVTDPTIVDDPDGPSGIQPPDQEEIGTTIIGVFTQVTSVSELWPGDTKPTATSGSEFGVPRYGSISFLCNVQSTSGSGYTQDIDIKYESQLTYCPIPWGAIGVAITEWPGVVIESTLIRGESERDLALRAAGVE